MQRESVEYGCGAQTVPRKICSGNRRAGDKWRPDPGISFRISAAFAVLAAVSDRETVKLLEAVMHDFDLLRDLEREDSFIKGFRCAAELLGKGEQKQC